ncbi:hypothetical protein C0992_000813 [Termitomyces sp. T32_za158]|nr:hypothetical protein C0992_000813 [Termitomyces sp. T32_za158]
MGPAAEISRLQNSLQHLKQTQTTLQEYIDEAHSQDVDPEITKALEENRTVIGSQEERILILRLALSEKGVHYGSHYDSQSGVPIAKTSQPSTALHSVPTATSSEDDDSGIHL